MIKPLIYMKIMSIFNVRLQDLLDKYSDRFDEADMTASNMPPVGIKLRPDAKGKTFYRPERRKPPLAQNIMVETF